jgi:hypothetical protein
VISLFCAASACAQQTTTKTHPELTKFEKTRNKEDLDRLFEISKTALDEDLLVYANIHDAMFPASWEAMQVSIGSLARHQQLTMKAILSIARLRGENYDVMRVLELAAILMDRWPKAEWRRQTIEAFGEYQSELLKSDPIRQEYLDGQLDNTSDFGSLRVYRVINLSCALLDLSRRYQLRNELSEDLRSTLAFAEKLAPSTRARFEPQKVD